MKAALGTSRSLTEVEAQYAIRGQPDDVSFYELLLRKSPEHVFQKRIQQHGPPIIPGVVWKALGLTFVILWMADIFVVFTPNAISDWLISAFGALPAAFTGFGLLLVFPASAFGSWRLANRRSSEQYPLVPATSGFELLEVPENDARFTCPECQGGGKWQKTTRYQAARWETVESGKQEEDVGERMEFVPEEIRVKETVCTICSGRGYLHHMKKRFEKANRRLQKLNSNLDVVNAKVEDLNHIITTANWEIVQNRRI